MRQRAKLGTHDDVWCIILAAGSGSRFGGRKQFLKLGDLRLVDHSVLAAASVSARIVLVLPEGIRWDGHPVTAVARGGGTRMASVRSGLRSVPLSAGIIVIHDAAHPLASTGLFEALIAAVRQPGVHAAIPVVPATDTLARIRGERMVATLSKDDVVSVQAPQAFRAEVLRAAHENEREASDDSVLVHELGATVTVMEGDPGNIHITTRAELAMAETLLRTP